jgi:hypothetical protein
MKKINNRLLISILGFSFIILFFVISMFQEKIDASSRKNEKKYELYYSLYNKLGYKLKDFYSNTMPEKNSLIIFFDYDENDKQTIEKILEWVKTGGTLFISGFETGDVPFHHLNIKEGKLGKLTVNPEYSSGIENLNLESGKYFTNQLLFENILSTENGSVMYETRMGSGKIIVLSDSTIMSTGELKKDVNAIFVNNILKPYYEKNIYIFKNKFLFSKTLPPLAILFSGKFLIVTLHFILIGILFIFWKGIRFGKPVLINPYSNRTIEMHLKAVGNFYKKTNSRNIIDLVNNNYFKYSIKKHLGLLKSNVNDEQLSEKLEKIVKIDKKNIKELFEETYNISPSKLLSKEKRREEIIKIIGRNKKETKNGKFKH